MIKRVFSSMIIVIVLMAFAACGKSGQAEAAFTQEDLYLTINGTQFRLNDNIETVIAILGSDFGYAEGISCDYDGLDKTYLYEDVEFYTWPMPEGDLVNEIYSASTTAATSKGITVGASKAEVLAAYGQDVEDTGYQLIYRLPGAQVGRDGGLLCFDLEGDAVTAVYITNQEV